MHSSRMCTARLLPVSPSMHCSQGGVPAQRGGVPAQGVYLPRGVYQPGGAPAQGDVPAQGGVPSRGVPAQGGTCPGTPPCGQTDMCKNIIFANFVCGR